ncbi:uncharacterized protein CMU_005040 [Cryptosporidium muris RN66]|uniref:Uncharacterized protein n=1 Tax=Cryptosporidium muris (strain RN66) TaxID=441375 RepID=B6AHS4_CRYMR|nr:uncharacterized protein CMU_005040 [Cryptosporidium muris RN66]EEA07581.1 hypothetical protein CMU_005040 [Cryptosporidium muris RN66]|eukprot:XP_002141930.1 hypothetical protein [Cryptosporidium muris RN66]
MIIFLKILFLYILYLNISILVYYNSSLLANGSVNLVQFKPIDNSNIAQDENLSEYCTECTIRCNKRKKSKKRSCWRKVLRFFRRKSRSYKEYINPKQVKVEQRVTTPMNIKGGIKVIPEGLTSSALYLKMQEKGLNNENNNPINQKKVSYASIE